MKRERSELNNKLPKGTELFLRHKEKEEVNTSESTLNKSNISITELQGRQKQLLSQCSLENVLSVSSQTDLSIDTAPTSSISGKNTISLSECFCKGNANTQPTKKNSITRDNQNKKFEDSLKFQIHKLTQEIADINNDIENKRKQYSLIGHRVKVEQLTDELSETQNQVSSDTINAALTELKTKVDFEGDKKMMELMNSSMKKIYMELIKNKKELQQEIEREQSEINVILAMKQRLEEHIRSLSTAVTKIEAEERKTEQNTINNPDKQDDLKIIVNERKKEKHDGQKKSQQKSELSEESLEQGQFESVITDDELIKEIHEKIAVFENKLDEIMEAHDDLENFIRENREKINLHKMEDETVKSIKRIIAS